jgi:hypothetical protein
MDFGFSLLHLGQIGLDITLHAIVPFHTANHDWEVA